MDSDNVNVRGFWGFRYAACLDKHNFTKSSISGGKYSKNQSFAQLYGHTILEQHQIGVAIKSLQNVL